MSLVKTLPQQNAQAVAIAGTETQWVYNYILRQRISVLGVKLWKTVGAHTFTFPRYSLSPHRDGLVAAMREQRNRYSFA